MTTLDLPASGPWDPEHVKAARAALGMTQQQLAEALELGGGKWAKDSVRNWERGAKPISGPSRVAIRCFLREKAAEAKPKRGRASG